MRRAQAARMDAGMTFPCPFSEGAGITSAACHERCSVVARNRGTCSQQKCESPWRLCVRCVIQGVTTNEAIVVDSEAGLCRFHQEHGTDARRGKQTFDNSPPGLVERQMHHAEIDARILKIPTDQITPMPNQPREYFDREGLERLAASIKIIGQREPGQVRRTTEDDATKHPWQLVDGQRRWHACKLLGIKFTCYEVKVADADEQFALSVASNFARQEHTPMEIAHAIRRLMAGRCKYTASDVAALMAHTTSWVYNYMKLLKLHETVRAMLDPSIPEERQIGLSVAMALSDIPEDQQLPLAKAIVTKGLTINRARHLIRRYAQGKGLKVGGKRGRKPDDVFGIIQAFVHRTTDTARMYLEMKPEEFVRLLQFRKKADRRLALQNVQNAIQALQELKAVLDGAAKQADVKE